MNLWVIPALVSAVVSAILGITILYINPKRSDNRWFSLAFFFAAVWSLGQFLQASSTDPRSFLLGAVVGWFGACFIGVTLLNLALVYPRKRKITRHRFVQPLLYLPFVLFYITFLTNNWHHLFYETFTFEKSAPMHSIEIFGPIYWLHFFASYAMIFLALILFVKVTCTTRSKNERMSGMLLVAAIIIPLLSDIYTILMPLPPFPETSTFTATGILLAIAILKYKLPYKEYIMTPLAEELITTPQKYSLEKGLSYLVKEEKLEKSYDIFHDQVTHDISGLSITKLPPEKVRERYKIAKSPILWLTFKEVENAISPKDIEGLKSAISDFIGKTEKPVILLDCFDQLRLVNGFEKSMSMLMEIKDTCSKNNANLLISVNPEMFEEKQMAAIEKELKEVKV